MTTLKDKLNDANPNQLPDMFRAIKLGDILRALPVKLYKKVPTATPANMIAAVDALALPDDAKATKVVRAYARAGTGTPAELTVDAPPMSSATAAGHVNVSESGDITFAAADAWTSVDVEYMPEKLDIVTVTLPVASDALAIPAALTARGAVRLLSAVSNAGSVTGTFSVIAPSNSKPGATKQASLKLAKDIVLFKASDGVTNATVKLGIVPAVDVDALLEASPSPFI